MVAGDDPAAGAKRDHRGLQMLGQREDLRRGVLRPAAHHDQRVARPGQQLGQAIDRVGVERRRALADRIRARALRYGCADGEDVPRRLQRHRPRASGGGATQPLGDEPRGLDRVTDALRPLRQRAQRGQLVGQLVQMPQPAADVRRRHLAGQTQQRRAGAVRGAQPPRRVQDPRPGHDGVHARAPRRLRVAVRHVGGRLLMARRHHPDLRRAPQRIEQLIRLHARDPEHGVHALAHERTDHRLPGADRLVAHARERMG